MCLEYLKDNDEMFQYFTGYKGFKHFIYYYEAFFPGIENLDYLPMNFSPQDQLFLTFCKLRLGKDNVELAFLFGLDEKTVARIFDTMTGFLYFHFKSVDVWTTKEVVQESMPSDFKRKFPSYHTILDATEVKIMKPTNIQDLSASFSSYKNTNTVKTMIGVTPRGVVNFISDTFAGSTSDRQIIERSDLVEGHTFEPGETLMIDRGGPCQDLLAKQQVAVNAPT